MTRTEYDTIMATLSAILAEQPLRLLRLEAIAADLRSCLQHNTLPLAPDPLTARINDVFDRIDEKLDRIFPVA